MGDGYKGIKVSYSIEETPLGTGGAIKQAMDLCTTSLVAVVNGDTILDIDLQALTESHKVSAREISMALVNVDDVSRYGSVELTEGQIAGFSEKGKSGAGFINGGTYLLTIPGVNLPEGAFSFEDEILKKKYSVVNPFLCENYFIDIGIPSDYYKACHTFKS